MGISICKLLKASLNAHPDLSLSNRIKIPRFRSHSIKIYQEMSRLPVLSMRKQVQVRTWAKINYTISCAMYLLHQIWIHHLPAAIIQRNGSTLRSKQIFGLRIGKRQMDTRCSRQISKLPLSEAWEDKSIQIFTIS